LLITGWRGSGAVHRHQSITLFEELFGPYPYDSLTVAENGFFGGMEYSALITISDYAYISYPGDSPSLLHALVSHETAHQWWYGAVGNDQANEPWLDESLAFYSELLYFERTNPDAVPWWWERRVDVYNPQGPVDATIYTYDVSASFITSMYGQAARFLRDLRETMGDDVFFAFLHDYYAAYSGRFATGADFKEMARSHSEADLTPLFEAYFAKP
jgi:aminopeptidase N